MEGWRWGIFGSSRPSPAVPVNLAPLKVRRRGNPEEQASSTSSTARHTAVPITLFGALVSSLFLTHTPAFIYCRYITYAPSVLVCRAPPSKPRPRQHTLHTTRRESHRHTLAFDAHTTASRGSSLISDPLSPWSCLQHEVLNQLRGRLGRRILRPRPRSQRYPQVRRWKSVSRLCALLLSVRPVWCRRILSWWLRPKALLRPPVMSCGTCMQEQ